MALARGKGGCGWAGVRSHTLDAPVPVRPSACAPDGDAAGATWWRARRRPRAGRRPAVDGAPSKPRPPRHSPLLAVVCAACLLLGSGRRGGGQSTARAGSGDRRRGWGSPSPAGRSLIFIPSHCLRLLQSAARDLSWFGVRNSSACLSRTERFACSGTNQPDPEFPVGGALPVEPPTILSHDAHH